MDYEIYTCTGMGRNVHKMNNVRQNMTIRNNVMMGYVHRHRIQSLFQSFRATLTRSLPLACHVTCAKCFPFINRTPCTCMWVGAHVHALSLITFLHYHLSIYTYCSTACFVSNYYSSGLLFDIVIYYFSLCTITEVHTLSWITPEGRPGMSDVSSLAGISGLSFDSTLLSPLLFFCQVLLPFLSYLFLPAGTFF